MKFARYPRETAKERERGRAQEILFSPLSFFSTFHSGIFSLKRVLLSSQLETNECGKQQGGDFTKKKERETDGIKEERTRRS